ncbi:hypothetical protein ScPMuIL_008425 [Solemya velum]
MLQDDEWCITGRVWVWQLNQKVYVAYRLIVAVGLVVWTAVDLMDESRTFYQDRVWVWFIFATNWSFLLLTITAVYQGVCVVYYTIRSPGGTDYISVDKMHTALKVQWLLQNLSCNSAIVVTISYWSFIAFLDHSNFFMTDMSQLKHTLNTVYVLLDILIGATPFRVFHMLFTICLGSIYSLFNAVYFLNDGTILEGRHYAYNVLDWGNPTEAIVTSVLCILQSVLSQIILYELFKIRTWIFYRIYFRVSDKSRDSELQSIMEEPAGYMTYLDKVAEEDTVTTQ